MDMKYHPIWWLLLILCSVRSNPIHIYETTQYEWPTLVADVSQNDTLFASTEDALINATVKLEDLRLTIEFDHKGPSALHIHPTNDKRSSVSLLYDDERDWNEIRYFKQSPPPSHTYSIHGRRRLVHAHRHANRHGYHTSGNDMTWTQADHWCRSKGFGRGLVSIHSWRQNYYVWRECRRTRFRCWIGLNDRGRENHWRWSDGTRVNFRAWSWGEPNDAGRGEDCTQMWGNRRWNDIGCNARLRAICWGRKPGPPAMRDSYWNRRYKRIGRFTAVFPGKPWGWWWRHRVAVAYTYNQCAHFCRWHFGGLASIHSEMEQRQVHHACYYILIHPKARDRRYHPGDYRGHACWIGLRERKKHGVKKWMDNTDVTYKKWWRGQSRYWRHDQHANNQKHRSLLAVALSEETYDEQEMGRDYGDWYSDYGHHRCVEMYRNGWWRERRCYEKKACVCQDPRARVVGKYIGISAVKSYHEAEKYCYKHYGTALATISNDAENKEHNWEDGEENKFKNWWPGEPNNWGGRENCVEMYAWDSRGRWNDNRCHHVKRYFVCNMQSQVQRMEYEDREKMIAKRMNHHREKWQRYRMHEYREKMRKHFREMMQKMRMERLKHFRIQREKQRDYIQQLLFNRMMQQSGLNTPYRRYSPGMMEANRLMGNSFGGHFGNHFGLGSVGSSTGLGSMLGGSTGLGALQSSLALHNYRSHGTHRRLMRQSTDQNRGREDKMGLDMDHDVYLNESTDKMQSDQVDDEGTWSYPSGDWDGYVDMAEEDEDMLSEEPIRCVKIHGVADIDAICLNLQFLSIQRHVDEERENQDIVNENMDIVDVSRGVQWVEQNVFDFGHDLNGTKQCFPIDIKGQGGICLEYNHGTMCMDILFQTDQNRNKHHLEFDADDGWTELNRIETQYEKGSKSEQLSKCTVVNHSKICLVEQCAVAEMESDSVPCENGLTVSRMYRE